MRRLREQGGHTLVEVLAAMGLMMVVLGSTLGAFDSFGRTSATNEQLNEAQDEARRGVSRMTRELRSASAYGADAAGADPSAVVRAQPWDLIFQSVDPLNAPGAGAGNSRQLRRVRYCVNTESGVLWRQWQTWTNAAEPPVPAAGDCPGGGWGGQEQVVGHIANGGGRRVFTYNSMDPNAVSAAAPAVADISSIRFSLFVDVNSASRAPSESQLASGVFLRNKNRRPTAGCTATPIGSGHVSLNGTASQDPEGEALTFEWKDGSTVIEGGNGPILDYTLPTGGAHTFTVTVKDPGNLPNTATCTTG
jgi:type II secretory pathway component PulJ